MFSQLNLFPAFFWYLEWAHLADESLNPVSSVWLPPNQTCFSPPLLPPEGILRVSLTSGTVRNYSLMSFTLPLRGRGRKLPPPCSLLHFSCTHLHFKWSWPFVKRFSVQRGQSMRVRGPRLCWFLKDPPKQTHCEWLNPTQRLHHFTDPHGGAMLQGHITECQCGGVRVCFCSFIKGKMKTGLTFFSQFWLFKCLFILFLNFLMWDY